MNWIQVGISVHTGLDWDAALKITKVQLELLSDPDMLLMNESGIKEESQQYHTAMLKPTTNIR